MNETINPFYSKFVISTNEEGPENWRFLVEMPKEELLQLQKEIEVVLNTLHDSNGLVLGA